MATLSEPMVTQSAVVTEDKSKWRLFSIVNFASRRTPGHIISTVLLRIANNPYGALMSWLSQCFLEKLCTVESGARGGFMKSCTKSEPWLRHVFHCIFGVCGTATSFADKMKGVMHAKMRVPDIGS